MTTRAPYPQQPPGDHGGPGGDRAGGGRGSSGRDGSAYRRRSRLRTVIPLAVAAWALLEIWLLTLVGEAAGGLTVLALLAAGVFVGAAVIKRAGRRAWSSLTSSVQQAQQQARAEASGGNGGGSAGNLGSSEADRGGNALAMLGGLLLMVPGLLSDAAGLLCLFPPTAALLRRGTRRYLGRRSGFAPGTLGDAYQQARRAEGQMRARRPDGKVVEGEVVRDDEPPVR